MLLTFLGLVVIIIPFILVFCFKDRLFGFLSVVTLSVVFHLILAFTTQLLHIFTYKTILTISILVAILSIFVFLKNKLPFKKININWLAIVVFLVIIFQLLSVHYLYTGSITTLAKHDQKVSKMFYPYPYFSDEWVGVSVTSGSIENHSLPTVNTLYQNGEFKNPFVPFFSFLSDIFLLLKLDPLTGYSILSFLAGLIICLFSYLFLRRNKVSNFVSLLTIILITYITNGANIPGIWYLLPYTPALILFLISLLFLSIEKPKEAVGGCLLSIIFYPPIAVFVIPTILVWWMVKNKFTTTLKYVCILAVAFSVIIISIIGFAIKSFNIGVILHSLFSDYLIRSNLLNGIPSYGIWNIIPYFILPVVIVGVIKIFKDKKFYILVPAVVGLIFWIGYLFTENVLVIGYPRIVVITSIFLVIISGFGFDWIFLSLRKKYSFFKKESNIFVIKIVVLAMLVIFSFSYTNKSIWSKLTLKINSPKGVMVAMPESPANYYLTSDDLVLFKNISKKVFVSLPWKGLVVGAATGNFPTDSKSSIITNKILSYGNFMKLDCPSKKTTAKDLGIDYIYSEKFDCASFSLVGTSREGLYLYSVDK